MVWIEFHINRDDIINGNYTLMKKTASAVFFISVFSFSSFHFRLKISLKEK